MLGGNENYFPVQITDKYRFSDLPVRQAGKQPRNL